MKIKKESLFISKRSVSQWLQTLEFRAKASSRRWALRQG